MTQFEQLYEETRNKITELRTALRIHNDSASYIPYTELMRLAEDVAYVLRRNREWEEKCAKKQSEIES